MRLNSLLSLGSYWTKDPMFTNTFVANPMTHDRFLLLHRCIDFCDNVTGQEHSETVFHGLLKSVEHKEGHHFFQIIFIQA